MRTFWRVAASLALAAALLWPGGQARAAGSGWSEASPVRFQPLGATVLTAQGLGSYRGAIQVSRDPGGLSVVNDVGFEDYLQGISEMPPTWPAAALQAQAIAARTYALWEMLVRRPDSASGAQICATDACQVYRGLDREREAGDRAWAQAVTATAGQVLLYQGKVIEAMYGSSNGGRTGDGGVPWLPSVEDPDDSTSPMHSWHWTAPLSSVGAALGVPANWTLTGVSQNGSTLTLALQAADGSTGSEQISLASFHDMVNANLPTPAGLPYPLPSWSFTVSSSGDQLVVDGGGFGHGMGLSQYGALGKAERGWSAADIVAAYYGGVRPTRLLPGQEPATIKVGLGSGLSSLTVGANGPFEVVGADGRPLAVMAAGWWTLGPGPDGTVEVTPPTAYAGPLAISSTDLAPGALRLSLTLPAVVHLTVEEPGLDPVALPPRVLGAGTVTVPLPPGHDRGLYEVTVEADAGAGRTAALPVEAWLGAPLAAVPPAPAAVATRPVRARRTVAPAMAGAALLLLSAAAVAAYGWRRRDVIPGWSP
ncbi:MAG TPA: SpoIID/LytB domain-containing protein [Acidimicrobiales bacterium]|nr:SpoIID/LytB domain-containing protein [Acidimicrobiales bacterium]